jgi:hypothetical protein
MSNLLAKKYTISEEQSQLIIEDYLSGKPVKEIYEKYDIHSTTLYYILDVKKVPTRNSVRFDTKTEKQCRTCKSIKPLKEFKKHPQNKDGYGCHCLDCYRKKDRKIAKTNRAFTRYGITEEAYQEMFEKQNHLCAICGSPETSTSNRSGGIKRLSIDHNHKTGEVRGLLCHKCNSAIGLFEEDIERMKSAIDYLS